MKRSFIGGECMLSGFYQELHQPQTYDCLSIQCGLEGKRFVERRCSVRFDTVCNTTGKLTFERFFLMIIKHLLK